MAKLHYRWQYLLPRGDVDSDIVYRFLELEFCPNPTAVIQQRGKVRLSSVKDGKLVTNKSDI